jgi:hypothetical protein
LRPLSNNAGGDLERRPPAAVPAMTDPDTSTSRPPSTSDCCAAADSASAAGPAQTLARGLMRAMTGPLRPPAEEAAETPVLPAVVVAEFTGLGDDGAPLVRLPGQADAIRARTVVALPARLAGRQVLVVHETGRQGAPIVTGVLREEGDAGAALPPGAPFELEVDGQRVALVARQQLVLRCGEASVTLTREGKILLRGTYVSSRSSGVHRIHGAVVEIN